MNGYNGRVFDFPLVFLVYGEATVFKVSYDRAN